jgi:protein AFG1
VAFFVFPCCRQTIIMKLRVSTSRGLQSAVRSHCAESAPIRRSICIQCHELHTRPSRGAIKTTQRATANSQSVVRRSQLALPAAFIAGQRRGFATVENGIPKPRKSHWKSGANRSIVNPDDRGPINEYDDRVAAGRLRDDEHQRG